MAVQPDGNILSAADFENVNGTPRDRLARLYGDNPPPLRPRLGAPVPVGGFMSVSFLSEPRRQFTLEFRDSLDPGQWTAGTTVAGDGTAMTLFDPNVPFSGRYYRVRVD